VHRRGYLLIIRLGRLVRRAEVVQRRLRVEGEVVAGRWNPLEGEAGAVERRY